MFARRERVVLIATMAMAAMTFGCATSAAEVVQVATEGEVDYMPSAPVVEGVIDGSFAGWEEPSVTERMIIWTGDISLIVKDAEESLEKAQAIAKGLGGYVVNSSSWFEEQQLRARLTIRVPAEEFDAAMAGLKDLAIRVEHTNVSTQDVTEEYTDLHVQELQEYSISFHSFKGVCISITHRQPGAGVELSGEGLALIRREGSNKILRVHPGRLKEVEHSDRYAQMPSSRFEFTNNHITEYPQGHLRDDSPQGGDGSEC